MMKKSQLMMVAFLTGIFLMMAPLSAFAGTLLTQMGGNPVVVPVGQMIENVLAVGSDARIGGTVNDIVLVINGDTYLEPDSQVDLVIDLGGSVHNFSQRPAKKGIFELNFSLKFINNFLLAGAVVAGFWFLRFMGSLLGIILLTCLGYLLRNYVRQSSRRSEELLASSAARLFGIGTAVSLVFLALIILLSLTVIGIPLAILMLIANLIAVVFGIVPIMEYIGKKWLSVKLLEYPVLTSLLIEAIFFVALVNLPLIGVLFLVGSGIMGLGLVWTLLWLRYKQPKILV
ncbi:hypothetical protein [Desulfosporosinus metallidurans]|uniref:Uncharacterized protein n=1 Tax=Desulfosporosinus metallidurans TaxID=1888891 RepID=A0A1Q8QZC9_9FIRM|nr:hypothetical protein [Desulfosporosinus metallidurans]OLN32540.1 hypothetical protein DSOL_1578 [Desulfosporosinus metallidurans]